MRKLICGAVGAAVVLAALPLAACGGETAKNSYSIKAEYLEEEEALRCEMTATVFNETDNALSTLPFQIWANAYREGATYKPVSDLYAPAAYYDGESFGGFTLEHAEGASCTVGGADENILYAALGEPLYPDESVSLSFSFTVKLAKINHRLGVGENCVNLANFYPVLCTYRDGGFYECVYSENGDPFVSETANYSVELTVPAKYDVAGAVLKEESGGKRLYALEAENVRDVAFVLGDFTRLDGESCGVPVTYFYSDDAAPERTLSAACDSLAFFSENFGDYVYPAYTVVQTDFPYGGMEYPMLSMISSTVAEEQVDAVVVHETAHQWWYAMVGSDQFGEAWQDEGLAEWCSALFFEAHPAYGVSYREMVNASERSYRAFFSVSAQVKGEADTRMSRPLTEYTGLYEYRNIAYDKGVILFDRVRDAAGEKKLIKGLRMYAETYGGRIASPADLVSCLDKAGASVGELIFSFTEGRCVI